MKGFTLIEAVIYFALTSAIIIGILASSYPLFTNTERLSKSVHRDLESAFVFQKVAYLMNQATAISEPASGASGNTLRLTVNGSSYQMTLDSSAVVLSVNGGTPVPLTSSRVEITGLTFTRTAGVGGTPDTLTVEFSANGVAEGPYTRYVRF